LLDQRESELGLAFEENRKLLQRFDALDTLLQQRQKFIEDMREQYQMELYERDLRIK